jgi:regulator of cell morphogenesis and NO signaling
MNYFMASTKMSDIIRTNYHLLPVINRFGIRLGFKDKTVAQICKANDINETFFLAILNTFHNEEYFPESELLSFSPILIIEYLKKTHQYYLEYVLPKIEKLLKQLISHCSTDCQDIQLINIFYKKYKGELLHHIENEEKTVFPYALQLTEAYEKKSLKLPVELLKFSIRLFEKEHTNVDIKLNDLKNLVIKYLNPVYNINDCNEFLFTLFRFEKDIKDHARIEDKIFVPKIIEIENSLKNA